MSVPGLKKRQLTGRPTIHGERRPVRKADGYTLIILMAAISVMSIGLLMAVPVWQTQVQREKEEELIFRGKQYVEAIRLFQQRFPGRFPKTFEELLENRCLRKKFTDPMTETGEWNVILPLEGASPQQPLQPQPQQQQQRSTLQRILVAPENALPSIQFPQILGVVSSSIQKSIKIYNKQENYNNWLFFYGQDPEKMPEIVYYGQTSQTR